MRASRCQEPHGPHAAPKATEPHDQGLLPIQPRVINHSLSVARSLHHCEATRRHDPPAAKAHYPSFMSFGLSRGKPTITQGYGITYDDLPPIPEDLDTPKILAGSPADVDDPSRAHLDLNAFFADSTLPLELEIGSGKGTFLAQQAPMQPETNFLGIEYAGEFYRYAADRLRRLQIPNAKALYADAQLFLRWRVPDESLTVIHLYFADPWPKARHHKRRTVQDQFFLDVHRTLKPNGELRIVTDHLDYWEWIKEHFERFSPACPSASATGPATGEAAAPHTTPEAHLFDRHPFIPPTSAKPGEIVGTNFEREYRKEGRTFNAITLRKH